MYSCQEIHNFSLLLCVLHQYQHADIIALPPPPQKNQHDKCSTDGKSPAISWTLHKRIVITIFTGM